MSYIVLQFGNQVPVLPLSWRADGSALEKQHWTEEVLGSKLQDRLSYYLSAFTYRSMCLQAIWSIEEGCERVLVNGIECQVNHLRCFLWV